MKNVISGFLKIVILTVVLTSAVHAEHDGGQGKSQDGQGKYDSVSVAPEPSAFWLFLTGALMMTTVGMWKKKRPVSSDL